MSFLKFNEFLAEEVKKKSILKTEDEVHNVKKKDVKNEDEEEESPEHEAGETEKGEAKEDTEKKDDKVTIPSADKTMDAEQPEKTDVGDKAKELGVLSGAEKKRVKANYIDDDTDDEESIDPQAKEEDEE